MELDAAVSTPIYKYGHMAWREVMSPGFAFMNVAASVRKLMTVQSKTKVCSNAFHIKEQILMKNGNSFQRTNVRKYSYSPPSQDITLQYIDGKIQLSPVLQRQGSILLDVPSFVVYGDADTFACVHLQIQQGNCKQKAVTENRSPLWNWNRMTEQDRILV